MFMKLITLNWSWSKFIIYCSHIYLFKPSQHKTYSMYKKSVKDVTLWNQFTHLLNFNTCSSVTNENAKNCAVLHSVTKTFNPNQLVKNPTIFYCLNNCFLLCQSEMSGKCNRFEQRKVNNSKKILVRKEKKENIPVKPNFLISQTSSERIILTLHWYRIKNKEFKLKVRQVQEEISKSFQSIQILFGKICNVCCNWTPAFCFWSRKQLLYVDKTDFKGIGCHIRWGFTKP